MSLLFRNVEVDGRAGLDVQVTDGRIVTVGAGLARPPGVEVVDGGGGALIPGLCDHHIHILALAARSASVDLTGVRGAGALAQTLGAAAAGRPAGGWVRAIGYHEVHAGELTRGDLDHLCPGHPVRVQHQTGALWILNTRALEVLDRETATAGGDDPPGLERASGRLWRGDAWLRARIGDDPPPLAPVGARLAALGVTALTDASVTTDVGAAELLAQAHRSGDLPQRLTLMSGGPLDAPGDAAFTVGPVKILLDDHALIDLDDFIDRIEWARAQGRSVAVHCVTGGELALTLAAFLTTGARPGDRIEHGSVIPWDAAPVLRDLGLTVVSQPAFVRERGDRYLRETDPTDRPDLYRLASLRGAGVPLAASSDAPYADPDPWLGMAAAVDRRTVAGQVLGSAEALSATMALNLYLGDARDPGGPPRRVRPGEPADLVLLDRPLKAALRTPLADHVRQTVIGGLIAYSA
ncbi:MAG: amidohydrolase family protein [Phenylobacterium sp.]|nr:amidohydrolase family protein [Phenylobacterium sp.]